MKLDHLIMPHTRINSKWIKDLHVIINHKNPKRILGSKISDIVCSNILSNISPQAKDTKENSNQIGLHQSKNCTAKETINKIKRQPI